jgi:hypothetical protein
MQRLEVNGAVDIYMSLGDKGLNLSTAQITITSQEKNPVPCQSFTLPRLSRRSSHNRYMHFIQHCCSHRSHPPRDVLNFADTVCLVTDLPSSSNSWCSYLALLFNDAVNCWDQAASVIKRLNVWKNAGWMNDWINEQMKERMSEWNNE